MHFGKWDGDAFGMEQQLFKFLIKEQTISVEFILVLSLQLGLGRVW